MKLRNEKNAIIIEDTDHFIPKDVFECGQCFRWNREKDGSYSGIVFGKIINVKKEKEKIIIENTNIDDFNKFWCNYFDLNRDYKKIINKISFDDTMEKAVNYGSGIRILNQEPWETLVSFIVSTNKSIPMIKRIIEMICREHGDFVGLYMGKEYYSFPGPEKLARLCEDKLKECKMGFRAAYILDAAKKISSEINYFEEIKKMDSKNAVDKLKEIRGVGDKVAHCVMLFSLGMNDSFPVDVWIKRIMTELYNRSNTKEIATFAELNFGEYAGFAQQYLFYYARGNNIGKNTSKNY